MEQRHVADQNIIADGGRPLLAFIHMDDRPILNIGAVADLDEILVTPQHTVEPDARFRSQRDITDHARSRRDIGVLCDGRPSALIRHDLRAARSGRKDWWHE